MRKHRRRWLAFLISVLMVVSMIDPSAAFATTSKSNRSKLKAEVTESAESSSEVTSTEKQEEETTAETKEETTSETESTTEASSEEKTTEAKESDKVDEKKDSDNTSTEKTEESNSTTKADDETETTEVRENDVTFIVGEGAEVTVDDIDVTVIPPKAVDGTIVFSVAAEDGYEITDVLVDGSTSARKNNKTEDDDDYIIEGIKTDNTTVEVKTAKAMPAQKFSEETDDGLKVEVEAEKGIFPEGTTMKVTAISEKEAIEAAKEAKEAAGENTNVDTAIGVDISFYDTDGNEIEPQDEQNVKVNITIDEKNTLEGDDFSIIHKPDEGTPEIIDEDDIKEISGEGATFYANQFSIYVITPTTPDIATYIFYDKDGKELSVKVKNTSNDNYTEVTEQKVKDNETVYVPATPEIDGYVFLGWSKTKDSTEADFLEGNKEFSASVFATETVNLYPVYKEAHYVFFMDAQGRVSTTKTGVSEDKISTTDVTIPLASTESVTGWYYDAALTQKADDSIILGDSDITLYPKVETGHYLYFSTGSGASYIEPEFVASDKTTTEPSDPTRSGYTFAGWATTQEKADNGTADFEFGKALSSNTTIYAVWTPSTNTTYTVIYWKQSITDSKNATDGQKTYDYESSETRTGTTGNSVSPTYGDRNKGYTGFTYNSTKSTSVTIAGDGTTVLNVYYDRKLITIEFHNGSYTSTNDTSGVLFGRVYNQYVQLYRYNNQWIYRTYMGDVYYTGTRYKKALSYTYTGLYEQTLTQNGYTWPSEYGWGSSYYYDYANDKYIYSGITFLDAFILDDISDSTDNHTKLVLSSVQNQGTLYIRHYKQNLDGTYTYESPTNQTQFTQGSWTFTNKYNGFTVDSYVLGDSTPSSSSNWTNITAGSGMTFSKNLYIRYTRNKYTLSFYNYNATTKKEEILYEASLSDYASYVPNCPSGLNEEAYKFKGWYKDPSFTEKFDFNTKMPAAGLILYAKWEADPDTVTVHTTISGGDGDTTHELEIPYGSTVSQKDMPMVVDSDGNVVYFGNGDEANAVKLPEKTEWAGWATLSDDGVYTIFNFDTQIYEDIDLYPYYISTTKYSVTYDTGEGTGSVTDNKLYAENSYADIQASTGLTPPTGKVFLYWQVTKIGDKDVTDGAIYYPEDRIQISNDIELTAIYGDQGDKAKLVYHANYPTGSGLSTPSDYTINDIINNANNQKALDPNELSDDLSYSVYDSSNVDRIAGTSADGEWYFTGWNTKADGSGDSFAIDDPIGINTTNMDDENHLYAQWEKYKKVTVKKVVDGNMREDHVDDAFGFTYTGKNKSGDFTLGDSENTKSYATEKVIYVKSGENLEITEATYSETDYVKTTYKIGTGDSQSGFTVTWDAVTADMEVVFTNTYKKASTNVTLEKLGTEDSIHLAGAGFELKEGTLDEDGTWKEGSNSSNLTTTTSGVALENLYEGNVYRLTETTAPSGYQKLDTPIYIKVTADEDHEIAIVQLMVADSNGVLHEVSGGISSITESSKVSCDNDYMVRLLSTTDTDGNTTYTIHYHNEPLYELPHSGGSGIYVYMIGGIMLMVCAAFIILKSKEREVL